MTLVKARSRGINLADTFAFTGTVSGAGKVLQVQSFNTTSNMSTSSTSFVATVLLDTITCSSTSNKVLILINGGRGSYGSGESEGTSELHYQVGSGSFTQIISVHKSINNQAGGFGKPSMSFSYLHSPSSTSALTYKVFIKTNANTHYLNSDSSHCNITLMEIAG